MNTTFRKLSVTLLSFLMAASFVLTTGCGKAKQEEAYNECIDRAEDYMDDEKYKKAISEYEDALEIFDDRDEPYIGIAEAYIAQDDLYAALDILKDGKRAVDDNDDILDMIEEINLILAPDETGAMPAESTASLDMTSVNNAYIEVLNENSESILAFENRLTSSVKSTALWDVTGDGIPELIFTACFDDISSNTYIYGYDANAQCAVQLLCLDSTYVEAGGGFSTSITLTDDGKLVVFSDGGDESWSYFIYEYASYGGYLNLDRTLTRKSSFDYDTNESIEVCNNNSNEITLDEYIDLEQQYKDSSVAAVFPDPRIGMYYEPDEWEQTLTQLPQATYYYYDLLTELS
ncbi:MAG: tetratricopeptide repeat protein [Saccharofermentans sp.]|nr:tetratricopeptide repeat protein [Saccharofermentans sp.]